MQLLIDVLIIFLLWNTSTEASSDQAPPMAKPNCQQLCGDVSIPYPFGIGPNKDCYIDKWFEIECRNYSGRHKPFLSQGKPKLEVLEISIDGTLRVKTAVHFFYEGRKAGQLGPNFTGSPFVYSQAYNRFTAFSCGFFALMRSDNQIVGGCMSTCVDNAFVINGCIGTNCCQTTLPQYLSEISTELQFESAQADSGKQPNAIFLVEQAWFQLSNFRDVKDMDNVPVVLEWRLSLDKNSSSLKIYEKIMRALVLSYTYASIPYKTRLFQFIIRREDDPTPYCNLYNSTSPTNNLPMLECLCPAGYNGNPFLAEPCQDIDECQEDTPCMGDDPAAGKWNFSGGACQNTGGGHICYSNIDSVACEFHSGWSGAVCSSTRHDYHSYQPNQLRLIVFGILLGFALLLLLIAAWYVYTVINRQKNIIRKKLFYKINGGLLLEQQLQIAKFNGDKIKLFKSEELEKSTDNFSINRILGHGGHGTVYKGMLKDGRIIAVKKSKLVDESKLAQFINEVVILSEIKHRNVVKLLGCCLETEVPLLVYEFIPNGTLFQYIHEKIEEFPLTWEMRLRIAIEIAGALSYLHATASCPIYHRDIKSSNILLDEKYRAKIADFGTSRLVAIDQTHLTTLVHGTFGYLDPEYFRSSKFTEKSDVYSFGVVLVELLTGKKPVSVIKVFKQEEEYHSLVACFTILMQENRLFEIVDAQVLKEGSKREIRIFADLANRCLDLNGKKRPTMREVRTELEVIQMSKTTFVTEQNYVGVEILYQDGSSEHEHVVSSSLIDNGSV